MKDWVNKAVSLGLGIAAATKEQTEKLVDELVKKGEMSRAESFAFVDDLLKKGEEAQRRIEALVQERVQAVVGDKKWATKEDIARLEQRLDRLIARLENTGGDAASKPDSDVP
ncbi:phasin family protein [Cohnella thermotolerans]|uniref:phasin family protein n=1 Tax=Cohnella thermotolerans TaxID=329858 RepID=UPI000411C07C|nr:ATP synthase subunit B [Cohnella thermotolerans]